MASSSKKSSLINTKRVLRRELLVSLLREFELAYKINHRKLTERDKEQLYFELVKLIYTV